MKPRSLLCLTLLCASTAQAAGQTDYFDLSLEELSKVRITVTAAGYQQSSSSAPASVTTIYESEWQALGARTVFDVLKTIPGIHVSASQQVFTSDTLIFRGLRNEDNAGIKLLIDGQPVEFLYSNGFMYTFSKPLTGLKRIEVIKGPGSAMYGSDAFAGVINLITKDTEDQNQLAVRAGENDSQDFGLYQHLELEQVNLSASLDYQQANSDPDRRIDSDSQSILDQRLNTHASLAPDHLDSHYEILDSHAKASGEQWQLAWWGWRNYDGGSGPGVAQALDPGADIRVNTDLYSASYRWDQLPLDGQLEATGGYQEHAQHMLLTLFPAGAKLPMGLDGNISSSPVFLTTFTDGMIGQNQMQTYRSYANLTYLMALGEHKLRSQVGYEDQEMHTGEQKNFANGHFDSQPPVVDGSLVDVSDSRYVYAPDSQRNFKFVALQDEWRLAEHWQLTYGMRYDDYSDFGSTSNPRVSLLWTPEEWVYIKLLYGTAFRAPSFFNQFNQNNPVFLGNDDLKPETIDTWELSADFTHSESLSTRVAVFEYKVEDQILFGDIPGSDAEVAQNSGELDGQGLEAQVAWKPTENLHLFAHHSFVDVRTDSGDNAADVPRNRSYLVANWKFAPKLSLNSSVNHVAGRERAAADRRADIDDYTTTNLKLEYDLGVKLGLSIDNLFDQDVREPSAYNKTGQAIPDDYPMPGRRMWLDARYFY